MPSAGAWRAHSGAHLHTCRADPRMQAAGLSMQKTATVLPRSERLRMQGVLRLRPLTKRVIEVGDSSLSVEVPQQLGLRSCVWEQCAVSGASADDTFASLRKSSSTRR
mmetsp:Transcript_61396/g.155423  ORF Transcript_61396/g.155423 Transcript_61396/m.155423 type:complete len:108 (-) Transcript_61396:303-626(-)